ncbi:putative 28S ribosomal protein S16 isoform 2 [Schistosoma japonicum]|uniref:Small ribosomal subunit protein bS16m n=2 Tax=Schistosoma japonicum TaxID=6182 RepID=A0A4Z2CST4_SCHJA|nr:putative 28S ribosomal protein S16, mitochondrial [Schistosoma japonicum]TNN07154.1 putative 28S ribosomal protein S16 isoform 2 [Schistosoma japonicum]
MLHFRVLPNCIAFYNPVRVEQLISMHATLHKFPLLRNLHFGRVPFLISYLPVDNVQPFIRQSTQSSSLDNRRFIPGPKKPSTWWPHQPLIPGRRVVKLYPVRFRHKPRIALVREGCANRPFFTIQIKSNLSESKKLGIEQVGSWDPIPNMYGEQLIALNLERIAYWLGVGAEPTVRVAELLGLCGFLPVHPRSYLMAHRARIAMMKYLEKQENKQDSDNTNESEQTVDDAKNTDIHSRVDSIWRRGNEPPDWWYYGLR